MKCIFSICILSIALAAACNSEVIYDTQPFHGVRAELKDERIERFIQMSERFATHNDLTFDVVRGHFSPNDFSILMTGADLNIVSLNTVDPGLVQINATVRGQPSPRHRELINQYIAAARPLLASEPQPFDPE